jgi:hypothetical protein
VKVNRTSESWTAHAYDPIAVSGTDHVGRLATGDVSGGTAASATGSGRQEAGSCLSGGYTLTPTQDLLNRSDAGGGWCDRTAAPGRRARTLLVDTAPTLASRKSIPGPRATEWTAVRALALHTGRLPR